jgi:two-component system, NtrC family, response regulator AtoC
MSAGSGTMTPSPASILVVDDEPDVLRYMKTILEVDAYRVSTARSGQEALQLVKEDPPPDLVLLDLLMPQLDGLQTLEQIRQVRPALKVVMLSCSTEPRQVVQAIRMGAQDYIAKPFQKSELDAVLKHYLKLAPVPAEPVLQQAEIIEDLGNDLQFAAASPAMRKIYAQIRQVAAVEVPVLILGESGTGKEVASRLIHRLSLRHRRTFMKVNCAALPGDLLESELFGYEPGAFTGAVGSKPGKFELCDKGTILLDEIGEMPPGLQAKLLHVLQDQQYSRLGGRTTVHVDVRILAATNVDVRKALETKKLREDLYYRLNTFVIQLPPLRERREEIPLLLRHFMSNFAERFGREPLPLSSNLMDAALQYPWPGNLRELENFVKRYLILGDEQLVVEELQEEGRRSSVSPEREASQPARPSGDLKDIVRKLKDVAELNAITSALAQTNWNRKRAAQLLNISYKALLYKIRQYGIQPMVFLLFGLASLLAGH